jgi:cellulose synthase/poly-beta-1,6-N-acetylglucosamine synthase-like glycosyltransferase
VRVGKSWFNAVWEAFRDPSVVLVGGPSRPIFETPPPEWLHGFYGENEHCRHCSWLSLLDGGDHVKEIDPCYVWGLNYAIRKETLFKVGGFNPDCVPKPLQRYQGDGESGLSLKVRRAGLKALYHPDASVEHEVPSARMTIEYFERRAFYQGVCASYTHIRATLPVEPVRFTWKTPLRKVKHFFAGRMAGRKSVTEQVRWRTKKATAKGYAFHQAEVRRDPKLLAWVRKENYWDYRLPDGWEAYVQLVS